MLKSTTWIRENGVFQASRRVLSVESKNLLRNFILGPIERLMTLVARCVTLPDAARITSDGKKRIKPSLNAANWLSRSASDVGSAGPRNRHQTSASAGRAPMGSIRHVKNAPEHIRATLGIHGNDSLIRTEDGQTLSTVMAFGPSSITDYWNSRTASALSVWLYLPEHLTWTIVIRPARSVVSSAGRVMRYWPRLTRKGIWLPPLNTCGPFTRAADGCAAMLEA